MCACKPLQELNTSTLNAALHVLSRPQALERSPLSSSNCMAKAVSSEPRAGSHISMLWGLKSLTSVPFGFVTNMWLSCAHSRTSCSALNNNVKFTRAGKAGGGRIVAEGLAHLKACLQAVCLPCPARVIRPSCASHTHTRTVVARSADPEPSPTARHLHHQV